MSQATAVPSNVRARSAFRRPSFRTCSINRVPITRAALLVYSTHPRVNLKNIYYFGTASRVSDIRTRCDNGPPTILHKSPLQVVYRNDRFRPSSIQAPAQKVPSFGATVVQHHHHHQQIHDGQT
ncbi:unnamed protein product [Ectocarpus sp. 12 AP-2014]